MQCCRRPAAVLLLRLLVCIALAEKNGPDSRPQVDPLASAEGNAEVIFAWGLLLSSLAFGAARIAPVLSPLLPCFILHAFCAHEEGRDYLQAVVPTPLQQRRRSTQVVAEDSFRPRNVGIQIFDNGRSAANSGSGSLRALL